MKAFWAIVLLLALAAGGLLARRSSSDSEARIDAGETNAADSAPPAGAPEPIAVLEAPDATEAGGAISGSAADGPVEGRDDEVVEEPEGTEPKPAEAAEADAPAEEDAAAAEEPAAPDQEPLAPATEPAAPAGGSPDEAIAEDAPTDELAAEEPAVESTGGGDAGLVLDGRYAVSGEGSAEDPYVVSWDTLVALEQEYNPKKDGMKEVPGWIRPLDGRHVRLTGFIAFPFIAPSADECMVMLNQWDGCCIGVPPTPYDAVEVKLAEPLDLQQGVINYGTITGVFRTDPYLVNGWLIGLYVMEDAKLTNAGGKNAPGF